VNTWKAIFAALVIFGAGVVTGGLLIWQLGPSFSAPLRHSASSARPVQNVSPGGMRLEFLRRVQRALDLTPAQRERVDKILKESQERTRKIMEPVAPEFHAELQRAKTEFRAVLNPEQQTRFDDMLKLQHRSHEERHPSSTAEQPAESVAQTNSP
jgi:hypothetical protein